MQQSNLSFPYVVADIGGTNARFALVTGKHDRTQNYIIENQLTFPSSDFAGIEEAYLNYIDTLKDLNIDNACLAVAGPVDGAGVKLTNLNWTFSIEDTRKRLGLDNFVIINDFAAYAYAIQYLDKSCLQTIKKGTGISGSPIAVLGPGTGFGVASLVSGQNKVNALALEGGHMALAANTTLQSAIIENLSKKFNRVTIEGVFSGSGLKNLYEALSLVEGTEFKDITTAEICQP